MYTIVITNMKGGVGKTSTTIELGAGLARHGKKVLVIDLDQQRNLTDYLPFEEQPQKTIYNVLIADCSVEDTITHIESLGFDVIAGTESLSKADRMFVDNDDKYLLEDTIKCIEDVMPDRYEYILVDTGPTRNILMTMAYVAADYIIVPAECDAGSREGLRAIESDVEKLKNSRDHASHAKSLGYILTKYEPTNMHNVAFEELVRIANEKEYKPFVLNVRKSVKMSEIKEFKTSIFEYQKDGNPSIDYEEIVKEIIRRMGEEEEGR